MTRKDAAPTEPRIAGRAATCPEVVWESWIGTDTLSQVISQVVRQVEPGSLSRVAPADVGPAYQPLTLLALVTYCYTLEIYSAAEIEDMMRRDAGFRRACRNEFPDSHTIRRFRRQNRAAILRSLVETFRRVRDGCWPQGATGSGNGDSTAGLSPSRLLSCPNCRCRAQLEAYRSTALPNADQASHQALADEAQRRLETATWIDHMVLED